MECFDYVIFLICTLLALYYYGTRTYSHYEGTGVKHSKPRFPFIGSIGDLLFNRKEEMTETFKRMYNEHPDQKYIGLFEFRKPVIVIRDLNLIKQIAIKDFDHFVNRRPTVRSDLDSLFGNILFNLQGDKWRDMRATLSPAFTSSKMKSMFELVDECAKEFADHYSNKVTGLENDVFEIEMRQELSKFTNDVIASAAFGLKVNSAADENNEFYRHCKNVTTFKGAQILKLLGNMVAPWFMKLLKIEFLERNVSAFFKAVVSDTIRHRLKNNIVRNDMISLLMEAKKGTLKQEKDHSEKSEAGFATVQESALGKREVKRAWTDDELTAQAFTFFMGGFETVLNFLVFFFYEIVKNPEIQERLQREIDEFNSESRAEFVYTDLQKLKYLDMCISENLRMWSPAPMVDRVCNKTYNLPPPSDSTSKSYQISVGNAIWIPIFGLHHDPKYYPDPEKFDPERFSEKNRSNLNPMAFLPFGIGPRNCIGSRFALMEAKIIVFHLLSKFDFVTTSKTEIPLTLDRSSLNMMPKNGMNLGIKLRKNVN